MIQAIRSLLAQFLGLIKEKLGKYLTAVGASVAAWVLLKYVFDSLGMKVRVEILIGLFVLGLSFSALAIWSWTPVVFGWIGAATKNCRIEGFGQKRAFRSVLILFGPAVIVWFFWSPLAQKYVDQNAIVKAPSASFAFIVNPFEPPYPDGTRVKSIEFERGTLDVRLFIRVTDTQIRDFDLQFALINTSGQILSIDEVDQVTAFPAVINPLGNPENRMPAIIVRDASGSPKTVPTGGVTSSGTLRSAPSAWRISCDKLLENTVAEFVLKVRRPYRTKMIEGFYAESKYTYRAKDEEKTVSDRNLFLFDDSGNPKQPTEQDIQRISSYRRPDVKIWGVQVGVGVPPRPPTNPP